MLHALPFILALTVQAAGQQTPPPPPARVVPAPVVQRPAPRPLYDEKADAKAAIEAAVHAAATDDIRVLITWGANDDAGSMKFADARKAPEIAESTPSFFSDEYRVVNVDVGHLDKNLDLAKTYGVKLSADGLPALTVLDVTGKVVANTTAAALRPDGDIAGIDAPKVAAFLKQHQAPAPDAVAPFEAALKQAGKDGKTVFVWFSAPW
ncbi:MAG: hypothetical protein LAP85_25430 [Acidobacteriia bacterium]|nr:hypothetical protein [Terriglobia bacterium]